MNRRFLSFRKSVLPLTAVLALFVSTSLNAQTIGPNGDRPTALDSLRSQWMIELPRTSIASRSSPSLGAAMNSSTPSAFIAEWGDVYAGAGYQHRSRPTPLTSVLTRSDGIGWVGIGLGRMDAVAVAVQYTSYSSYYNGPFTRGGLTFLASHQLHNGWAVGVGAERAFVLGKEGDCCASYYGVASRVFSRESSSPFLSTIGLTLGAGMGRFQPVRDVWFKRRGVNAFGAVGVSILDGVNALTEWNGQDLTVGLSIKPLRSLGIVISPAVTDLTGNAESPARFMIGVGMGSNFRRFRNSRVPK